MIEAIAIGMSALGIVLMLMLFARLRTVDTEQKLKKHRSKEAGLADLLIHAAVIDDGVIVGKRRRNRRGIGRNGSAVLRPHLSRTYFDAGRAASASRRGVAGIGAADATQALSQGHDRSRATKPNVGRLGRKPPAQSKNCLRKLSELGVVRIDSGSEVLLSRDVPRHVEHQGTQPTGELRWPVVGAGRGISAAETAALKYIAEREDKRKEFFDIKKHSLYNEKIYGVATYVGTRQIGSQALALLQRGDEITVMPIDETTARRLKRVRVGETVTIAPTGSIKTKGRSR